MRHRLIKPLSLVLGVVMFLFGFLKFFHPIDGWFDVQIQQSHLPHAAILAGKLGELTTGILFLLPWSLKSISEKHRQQILLVACLLLFSQMAVAIYVHLQPGVPASVLPLGIKRPFIPVTVLLLGIVTALGVLQERPADGR
jgi:hypothetical protein